MGANAQLREEEAFDPVLLMAGVDAFPEPIAVVEQGCVLYANHAFGNIPGTVSKSNLRGQFLADLLPETTRYVDSSSQPGCGKVRQHLEALVSDFQQDRRTLQLVSVRAGTPRAESGDTASEGPDMESAEKRLLGVAHDFGNVLTGIVLYSDLLVTGLAQDTKLCRHAEAIRRSGNDGIKLVQQLMHGTPPETPGNQPTSLNQVVSQMFTPLGRLVGKEIEIEIRLSESLGMVRIDASELQRIILNLVINARDAMPKGGKIILSTRNDPYRFSNSGGRPARLVPGVELSIADTGMGMDKHTLSEVFRPFFTTKPPDKGTGLGLAMVRKIVSQAGGEVTIESQLGKGTRVNIRLPRIDLPENPS